MYTYLMCKIGRRDFVCTYFMRKIGLYGFICVQNILNSLQNILNYLNFVFFRKKS